MGRAYYATCGFQIQESDLAKLVEKEFNAFNKFVEMEDIDFDYLERTTSYSWGDDWDCLSDKQQELYTKADDAWESLVTAFKEKTNFTLRGGNSDPDSYGNADPDVDGFFYYIDREDIVTLSPEAVKFQKEHGVGLDFVRWVYHY